MTPKERYRVLCDSESSIPLFSQDWWLDEVCGADKWDVLLFGTNDRIEASMPFYRPISRVVSMPCYTQTMGPWFNPRFEPESYSKRLNHRQKYCNYFVRQLKQYACFLQNFHSNITDWLPFYWGGYAQTTRYSYQLEGIADHEQLWKNLSLNIRRNITNAIQKSEIVVQKGIPVSDFLHVNALSFKRQKLSVKGDPRLLARLIKCCRERNQGDTWGAYDPDGNLQAAAFIVWQSDCAYYLAGGEDPMFRSSGAGSLVLWEAIKYVSSITDKFDFEGSMLVGVEHYFRKFGTKQVPYFTITKGKMCLLQKCRIKLAKIVTKQRDKGYDYREF